MSLGDALDFEKFQLGEWWKAIKDDPERLFLGALTPAGSELWGGITGNDYEPLTNWFGGPTGETYDKAQAEGIDTGSAEGVHAIAQAIAASYAGGYGADKLGVGSLPTSMPGGQQQPQQQQQSYIIPPNRGVLPAQGQEEPDMRLQLLAQALANQRRYA